MAIPTPSVSHFKYIVRTKVTQTTLSIIPSVITQQPTNNVTFTFSGGDTTWVVYNKRFGHS